MSPITLLFMEQLATDWWAKIITIAPRCIYYFGPFSTRKEAENYYPGYVEDLNDEGAIGIVIIIERSVPKILTICEEEEVGIAEDRGGSGAGGQASKGRFLNLSVPVSRGTVKAARSPKPSFS